MRKILSLLLIGMMAAGTAGAAGVPVKFPTDSVQFGKSGSTATKVFGFDFGLGASNPVIQVDNATKTLNYSKNDFSVGDGLASDKTIAVSNGSSPAPKLKWSNANQDWEFSNDGTNFTSIGSGSGSGVGFNVMTNPGFESGVSQGYTNTGGTFSAVTSGANLLIGRGSATFQASASGQSVQSTLYAVPNGLLGRACMAQTLYLGGDAGLTFQAIDGSSNVLASTVLTPTTTPKFATLTFLCPSSGSIQWQVKSTASGAIVALDQNFLGENAIVPLSQAQFLGSVVITGCSSAFSSTATSFTGFNTVTGCSYATSGSAQAPATNVPGIKFASIPPGELMLVYEGAFEQTVGNHQSFLQFSDGTNTARETSAFLTTSGGDSWIPGVSQSISYTTAQSNVTLQLFVKNSSGGTTTISGTNSNPGVIRAYLFPTQTQAAFRADSTPASWYGYQNATSGWTNTSASQADFTTGSGITLSQVTNRNFGTVSAGAGSLPAISLNFPRNGYYWVCANVNITNTATGSSSAVYLIDNNSVEISRTFTGQAASNVAQMYPLCGIYNASVGATTTLKLQGKVASGTQSLYTSNTSFTDTILWSIIELDAPMSAPYFQGNVMSSTTGIDRSERAYVDTTCSSSPCTITSQSGSWLTSITRSATGMYTLNIAAGEFSAAPVCQFNSSQPITGNSGSPTSTSVGFTCLNSSFAAADCARIMVTCQGPH